MSEQNDHNDPTSMEQEECVVLGDWLCFCSETCTLSLSADFCCFREEFKPAALDNDDGDDEEMSSGESEGGADDEDAAKSGSASASAHGDAEQRSGNDDASETVDAGDGMVKSEPEIPSPSQLSLSQMREKIAALEKVCDYTALPLQSLDIAALTPFQLAAPATPRVAAAGADADVGDGTVVMSKPVLADCVKEMERLKKLPAYLWFQDPVDPVKLQIPTYFDVIKKPMDFGTITRKLASGAYGTAQDFRDDLLLVVNNAINFNPADHQCHVDALRLKTIISTNLGKLIASHTPRIKAPTPTASTPSAVSLFDLPITSTGPTAPLFASCETIIQACLDKDTQKWFGQPIHPENDGIPHYRTIIKEPMDLSTVRSNLRAHRFRPSPLTSVLFFSLSILSPTGTALSLPS